MVSFMSYLQKVLLEAGIGIVSAERLGELRSDAEEAVFLRSLVAGLEILQQINGSALSLDQAHHLVRSSKAQLGQDLFAAAVSGFKRGGFFIEVGAADGVNLSNSWLLENELGWQGVLVEPARGWIERLKNNRSCEIVEKAAWHTSGEKLNFSESITGTLSTLSAFKDSDHHGPARRDSEDYIVSTSTITSILQNADAPKTVDFLSIDTEGSEVHVLQGIDFDTYTFNAISIEHNFTHSRSLIRDYLAARGYRRILAEYSNWDDWYVYDLSGGFPLGFDQDKQH